MSRSLRPFQQNAVAFLQADRPVRFLLDDAGLGKTASVLVAAQSLGLQRVLVLGPAVAGVSWPKEVATWAPGTTFTDVDTARVFGFTPPGVYFVSYDTLSRKDRATPLIAALASCAPWDLIVLDEAQYLKSPGANRTIAVYGDGRKVFGLAGRAPRVWVLSGTLTPNHAGEAYTHMRALLPLVLAGIPAFKGRVPDQWEFENHFCVVRDATFGRAIEGSRNQAELRAALAPHFMRRLKRDVLKELPPMEFFTVPVRADPAVVRSLFAAEAAQRGTTPADLAALDDDALLAFVAAGDGDANYAGRRRHLGLSKVPDCAAWVNDRLASGERKILVFANHLQVIEELNAALLDHGPVVYTGKTAPADRAARVDRFQCDPNCRVFIGNYTAAGTAVTLTAAKTVLFCEYSGTPGVNYQAASRAHRMGQLDGVQVYFAAVAGSLDERVARISARRARDVAELFD